MLSVVALFATAAGGSAALAASPRLLEAGQELGAYSLGESGTGARLVAVPRDYLSPGEHLDVFGAAPGSPFGPVVRNAGDDMPIFHVVAAAGPDGTGAIVGDPSSSRGGIGAGVVALVRTPDGAFSAPRMLTRADTDDPYVAIDRQGNAMAIWVRHRSASSDEDYVEASTRPPGGDWSPPAVIAHELHSAYTPQVAFDATGGAIAVWIRQPGPSQVVASMRPPGGPFGPPAVISDPRFDSDEASLSVNARGEAAVVWVQLTANDAHFRVGGAFRAPGQEFGTPRPFTRTRADATGASVALDDAGRALVAWRTPYKRNRGNSFWIKVARRAPGGPVGRAVRVGGPFAEIGALALAPVGRGSISWIYRGRRGDLVQARRVTTTGALGPVLQISPRGEINALHTTIDDAATTTFVWTRHGRSGDLLETTRR